MYLSDTVLSLRLSTSLARGLHGLHGFSAAKEGMEDDTDLLVMYDTFQSFKDKSRLNFGHKKRKKSSHRVLVGNKSSITTLETE